MTTSQAQRVTLASARQLRCSCAYTLNPIVRLHYRRKDHDMCVYLVEGWFPQSFTDERDFMDDMAGPTEVELCPHLLDYFEKAPALFYCQVSLP